MKWIYYGTISFDRGSFCKTIQVKTEVQKHDVNEKLENNGFLFTNIALQVNGMQAKVF